MSLSTLQRSISLLEDNYRKLQEISDARLQNFEERLRIAQQEINDLQISYSTAQSQVQEERHRSQLLESTSQARSEAVQLQIKEHLDRCDLLEKERNDLRSQLKTCETQNEILTSQIHQLTEELEKFYNLSNVKSKYLSQFTKILYIIHRWFPIKYTSNNL